jgi:hypothetical protein
MSRHTIPALNDKFTVVVEWDNPMRTYFAQVERATTDEEDDEDPVILWLGDTPDQVPNPESLREPLAPFAILPDETLCQLREDRAKSAGRPPTHLQRFHVDLLRGRR